MNVTLLKTKPTDTETLFLVNKFVYKYTQRGVFYHVFGHGTRNEVEVEINIEQFDKATQMRIWNIIKEKQDHIEAVNELLSTVRSQGPYGLGFERLDITENYGARNNGAILLTHPLLDGWNLINNSNYNFALTKVQKLDS